MDTLQIVILALIQGAAELLPVSSSAHVITAARFMGLDPGSAEFMFLLIMLHTGTMFAVIVYFWPRWRRLLPKTAQAPEPEDPWQDVLRASILAQTPATEPKPPPAPQLTSTRFLVMIILATAVTGVVGLGLKYGIEKVVFKHLLHHEAPISDPTKLAVDTWSLAVQVQSHQSIATGPVPYLLGVAEVTVTADREKGEVEHLGRFLPLIAGALFAAGILIIAAGFRREPLSPAPLTAATSFWIGLIQGLCLPFRGFSRSGATISIGLFRGLSRQLAEDFSFALAVALTPAVILYEGYRLYRDKSPDDLKAALHLLRPGLLGMACSFVSGLIALWLLSAMLENGRWRYFGYYCVVAAFGILGAAWYLGDLGTLLH
jgi:undecaprenyl-diphosphatase